MTQIQRFVMPTEYDLADAPISCFNLDDHSNSETGLKSESITNPSKIESDIKSVPDTEFSDDTYLSYFPGWEITSNGRSDLKSNIPDKMEIRFWCFDRKTLSIRILPSLLYEFLKEIGIRKGLIGIDPKNSQTITVQQVGNIITPVNINYLVTRCQESIYHFQHFRDEEEKMNIIDAFHRSTDLFSEKNLMMLDGLNEEFICDGSDVCYLFFRNTAIEVNKTGIRLIPLDEMPGLIWNTEIIHHEFAPISFDDTIFESEYLMFLQNITGTPERLMHLLTLIGYLLHRYKDPSLARAVILMDENSADGPEGGTGKTLLLDSIGYLRKIVKEDGKTFIPGEKFAFQKIEQTTNILAIDDVNRRFELQSLFELITGDFPIEKKYKDGYIIPFKKAPKIAITSNYTLMGKGGSYERRKFEFALSSYYSKKHQPKDDFGHNFFEDWDEAEWNMFYNIMLYACHLYLKHGVLESKSEYLDYKKLITDTCEEFVQFAESHIDENIEYNKKEIFNQFVEMCGFRRLQQRKFTTWVKAYACFKNLIMNESHSGDNNLFTLSK